MLSLRSLYTELNEFSYNKVYSLVRTSLQAICDCPILQHVYSLRINAWILSGCCEDMWRWTFVQRICITYLGWRLTIFCCSFASTECIFLPSVILLTLRRQRFETSVSFRELTARHNRGIGSPAMAMNLQNQLNQILLTLKLSS